MTMRPTVLVLLLVGAGLPARAGGVADALVMPEIELSAGPGVVLSPHYPGAAGSHLQPYPYIDGHIGDDISFDSQDGVRLSLLKVQGLEAGLAAGYRAGRATGDMPVGLQGLHGVEEAFTVGAFASYSIGPFSLDIQGLRDAVPGRRRLMLEIDADVTIPFGDPSDRQGISVGPYLQLANGGYQQVYFGVDAAQAAASGLPELHPNGGPLMAGVNLDGSLRLANRWSLRGFANWGRILSDAAHSPLVRQGGSADQFTGGLFLVHDF